MTAPRLRQVVALWTGEVGRITVIDEAHVRVKTKIRNVWVPRSWLTPDGDGWVATDPTRETVSPQ